VLTGPNTAPRNVLNFHNGDAKSKGVSRHMERDGIASPRCNSAIKLDQRHRDLRCRLHRELRPGKRFGREVYVGWVALLLRYLDRVARGTQASRNLTYALNLSRAWESPGAGAGTAIGVHVYSRESLTDASVGSCRSFRRITLQVAPLVKERSVAAWCVLRDQTAQNLVSIA
jgi:hypothetical protein